MHSFKQLLYTVLLLQNSILVSAEGPEGKNEVIECGLYIAESTIPGAGLGIFAGRDYGVGQTIGRGDVCIPFIDMYWHNGKTFFPNPFRDYFWAGTSMGMFAETDSDDIEAYCPGLDCAVNCHQGLLNVGKSYPEYDEGKLHRSMDPGAGAFTPYHNGTTKVIRDIPAGGELFKDYGPDWFKFRYHIFGKIPFSDDYEDARDLLETMMELKSAKQESVLIDLYHLVRGFSKKELFESRTLNALPEKIEDAIEAAEPRKDLGTILQKNYTRDLAYLQQHGKCIDHIIPKQSTIPQAGRGAFAVRNIPKGTVITASPLHHVPDKSFANMYEFVQVDGKWVRVLDKVIGKQIVLNYCYSHPATTVMLCPYGSQINYFNHNRERANVRIQWATDFALVHNQSIIDNGDYEFMKGTERPKLAFDFVATKDIAEGDEMFLDYGDDWIKAWEQHVKSFVPVPGATEYTSAHQWNLETAKLPIRTEYEQTFDPYPEHMEIRCHQGLMNAHGNVNFRWHSNDYGIPCKIKSRTKVNEIDYYTVDLVWDGNKGRDSEYLVERAAVPRESIYFFNRPGTTDIHLPNAFRHPIGIPDDMLPEGWRNVLESDEDEYDVSSLLDSKVKPEEMSKFALVDEDLYDDEEEDDEDDDDDDSEIFDFFGDESDHDEL